MITQTGYRSCCRMQNCLLRIVADATILTITSCAEIELGAEAYKIYAQSNQAPPTSRVLSSSAQQDSIDPAMRSDLGAFSTTGIALWDGAQTLPGIWIAHPAAETARRVRLTNVETGVRVDSAMFRRDPNLSGPRITVSVEAADLLGLTPGHATLITIEALAYGAESVAVPIVASTAGSSEPAPVEVPTEEIDVVPAQLKVTPLAAVSQNTPPVTPPVAVDTTNYAGASESEPRPEKVQPTMIVPTPQPEVRPAGLTPEVTGDITNGWNFIQAGVFGQPENAKRLVEQLRAANLLAEEQPLIPGERHFTRVVVGPYQPIAERDAALESARMLGSADATPARG